MKIIRTNEIVKKFGISRNTVYRLAEKDDFPKKIQLSTRAFGFEEDEIETFFKNRKLKEN